MKKIHASLFVFIVLVFSVNGVYAQSNVSVENLSPEVKGIIENVKRECGLNPNQSVKFSNDYVFFLNNNAKNITAFSGNQQRFNEETKKLLMQTGAKFRGYLNDGQFTKLTQMIQAGSLDPAKFNAANSSPVNTPSSIQQPVKPATPVKINNADVSLQSNVAGIFEQLIPYMKVSADQRSRALPILKSYDQEAAAIKRANIGNAEKTKRDIDALNTRVIPSLRSILNDDQISRLVMANVIQENILSGKNLSSDQRQFLQKLKNDYQLNDVQLMAVVLVMVEGKLRGDIIQQTAKSNPQVAMQELGSLLQDLDSRLKSALSLDQYAKVKVDIEKMIKG